MFEDELEDYRQFLRKHVPATVSRQQALAHTGQFAPIFDDQASLIAYQDKVADVYGAYEPEDFQIHTIQALLQHMRMPVGTLASLGCGPSPFELWALSRGKIQRYIGVDISPKMIERSASIATSLGIQGRVQFIRSDVESLQIEKPGSADMVWSINAMHWTKEWRKWIPIAASLLKPQGQIFLSATVVLQPHPNSPVILESFLGVARRHFCIRDHGWLVPSIERDGKNYQVMRYFLCGEKAPQQKKKQRK